MLFTVGHYTIRPGQLVYINDPFIFSPRGDANLAQEEIFRREPEVPLRVFTAELDQMLDIPSGFLGKNGVDISVIGYTAKFGADLSSYVSQDTTKPVPRIRSLDGVTLRRDAENPHGCDPYEKTYPDSMLIARRGHCTFLEKLVNARAALAAGIIVISDEELGINPTANADELTAAGDLNDVAIILLPKKSGDALEELVNLTEKLHTSEIMIALQPRNSELDGDHSGHLPVEIEEESPSPSRILYINGHPLINTRLLV